MPSRQRAAGGGRPVALSCFSRVRCAGVGIRAEELERSTGVLRRIFSAPEGGEVLGELFVEVIRISAAQPE